MLTATGPTPAIEAVLERFHLRYGVPAIGGGIVHRDGPVELAVRGVRVRGRDDPVQLEDPWHIGSCGKSITAALYARLVEAGRARWGATVGELFPDLDDLVNRAWHDVPVEEVLVHRSGLRANLSRSEQRVATTDTGPIVDQRTELVARALAGPPRGRGRFRYSNLGYALVGAAIERITGLGYEDALRRHLLEPLGMTSAGFGPPPRLWGHGGTMRSLGPLGGIDLGRSRPADPADPMSDNPPVVAPAGRLHVNLADWARFQRVFLAAGAGYLSPASVERLLTPIPGPGTFQALGWAPIPDSLPEGSFGQQGSNTYWVATAVIDRRRERTALVVTNQGSVRILGAQFEAAIELLARP